MATIAPAAARKCAIGNPTQTAISPHAALPSVKQPKNTVVYSASPRPRTQSGSATCAETLSVASAAIQDAPAMTLAASAVNGSRANPYSTIANA